MELQCAVQSYEWGKRGSESKVAFLAQVCNKDLPIEESKSYAELWMGTHVNGPSFVPESNEKLSVWLARNLDSLGTDARKQFGDDLPFLFKVLSVRTALSIQAHPNKKHAEELHFLRPDLYKDPNHKPELAVALSPFEALCGFRPIEEIKIFLNEIPELQTVLGADATKCVLECNQDNPSALKKAFSALMTQESSIVKENLLLLCQRLTNAADEVKSKAQLPLLQRLCVQFPGDVGCWSIYLMNYMSLQPGQAIFLGPNIPHAYIYGDCVECMACSDNVVRAGLTPKYIDVPTLIGMLIYESQPAANFIFQPQTEDQFTRTWRPPVTDFAVAEIKIPHDKKEPYNTILRPSASILIVVSGEATVNDSLDRHVQKGSVLYLKASRQLTITPTANSSEDLIFYQAMCNIV